MAQDQLRGVSRRPFLREAKRQPQQVRGFLDTRYKDSYKRWLYT